MSSFATPPTVSSGWPHERHVLWSLAQANFRNTRCTQFHDAKEGTLHSTAWKIHKRVWDRGLPAHTPSVTLEQFASLSREQLCPRCLLGRRGADPGAQGIGRVKRETEKVTERETIPRKYIVLQGGVRHKVWAKSHKEQAIEAASKEGFFLVGFNVLLNSILKARKADGGAAKRQEKCMWGDP